MNKTEKRKLITKLFCEMIEKNFPEYDIDESEGGRLSLTPTWSKRPADEGIEYSRSNFDLCSYNWASIQTKKDEIEMEKELNQIMKSVEAMP